MTNVNYPSPLSVLPLLIRSRLEAMFTWSWCTAISCLIIGQGFPPLRETLLAILAMIFISFSVYLYNDVIDIEMDRLNPEKKKRPLAANLISKKDIIKSFKDIVPEYIYSNNNNNGKKKRKISFKTGKTTVKIK